MPTFLQSVLVSAAGDKALSQSITFCGVVMTLVSTCYLLSAIHESRVNRLTEIVSSALLGAIGFGLVLHQGFNYGLTGTWVGLAFGLGLWLGYEFFLPVRRLMGDIAGGIQMAIHVVFGAILAIVLGLLHAILLPAMYLAGLISWFIIWLLTLPVIGVARVVLRRPFTLDDAMRSLFGLPRSGLIIMLPRRLPKSVTFLWLTWMSYRMLMYVLSLVIGYVVARVGDPVIQEALSGHQPDLRLLAVVFALGVAIGYIYVLVSVIQYSIFGLLDPRDAATASMESELQPAISIGSEIWEAEGVLEAATVLGSRGTTYLGKDLSNLFHSQGRAVESDSSEQEVAARERAAVIRPVTLNFADYTVGLLSGLAFGTLVELTTASPVVWIQRVIIFGFSFALGALVQRMSAFILGTLGAVLFVLGAAMQTIQFIGH